MIKSKSKMRPEPSTPPIPSSPPTGVLDGGGCNLCRHGEEGGERLQGLRGGVLQWPLGRPHDQRRHGPRNRNTGKIC